MPAQPHKKLPRKTPAFQGRLQKRALWSVTEKYTEPSSRLWLAAVRHTSKQSLVLCQALLARTAVLESLGVIPDSFQQRCHDQRSCLH